MSCLRTSRLCQARAGRIGVLLRMVFGLGLVVAPATTFAQNCTVVVPHDPLGVGLASGAAYQLLGSGCDETSLTNNSNAFVQVAIIDTSGTATDGTIYIYNPLIVNAPGTAPDGPTGRSTMPAVAPVAPLLPATYKAGIWFGFNGGVLSLSDTSGGTDLLNAKCQQGLGQFAYCNAVAFFAAANNAIRIGHLTVPKVGTGNDGQPCPTVRSFSVVDQDQSDNLTTTYLVTSGGQMAQNNPANFSSLTGAAVLANPSDNWLLDDYMAPALGCATLGASGSFETTVPGQSVMTSQDLTDPSGKSFVAAQALNELVAAANPTPPVALVPLGDPFTFDSMGNPNLSNVNAYRAGVNQVAAVNAAQASTSSYCTNLRTAGVKKLSLDRTQFTNWPSPVPSVATNLFGFVANRLVASWGLLNCQSLINLPIPITLIIPTTGPNAGVVTGATIQ